MSRSAISTDYIRLPSQGFPGPCTIAFWAKTPTDTNTATLVFGQGGRFVLERRATGDWRWSRPYTTRDARWRWAGAVEDADESTWAHYAFVHDGSLNAPVLYVNGVARPLTVDVAPLGTLVTGAAWTLPVYLLNSDLADSPFDGPDVSGGVSALALYDAVLSYTQVQRIVSVQRYPLAGLTGFYPLDSAPARDANAGTRNAVADTSRAAASDPAITLRYWEAPDAATSQLAPNQITLSWAPIPGASGYTVEYRPGSSGSFTTVQTSSPSVTLTGLAPATFYQVRISTRSAVQVSAPGTTLGFTTLASGVPVFFVPAPFAYQPIHLQIRDKPGGRTVANLSGTVTDLVIESDEHGCAAIAGAARLNEADAYPLVANGSGMHMQASVEGHVIATGRLEKPGIQDGDDGTSFTFTAYGYQQAFEDVPVTLSAGGLASDGLAAFLLSGIRAANPLQLASTSVIGVTGVTMPAGTIYTLANRRDILDDIAALGDNQNPPRRWQWTVWADRVFRLEPRGTGARSWYLEAGAYEAEQDLQQQYTDAAVSYPAQGQPLPLGVTGQTKRTARVRRMKGVQSDAASQADAFTILAVTLRDIETPLPRVRLTARRFTTRRGVPVPNFVPRAGDTVTVVDIAPTLGPGTDRFRTFRAIHARYNALRDTVELTLETPPAALDWLLARQKAGI